MSQRTTYSAGEKQCEVCSKDLPAIDCWSGRTHFYCDTPECRQGHTNLVRSISIGANEKHCEGPGCNNFIPAGRYDRSQKHFLCCKKCHSRFSISSTRRP
jgi:WD40 repeat protein